MKVVGLLLLAAVTLHAETPAKPKAPEISIADKAKFFKAQAQATQAQTTLKSAQDLFDQKKDAFNAAIADINKVCGAEFTVSLNGDGDPVCVPAPPKTPEKK